MAKKKVGRKSDHPWPEEHEAYLEGLFPEFESIIRTNDPELKGGSSAVTTWVQETCTKAMATPLFQQLDTTEITAADWEMRARRIFYNHRARMKTKAPNHTSAPTSSPSNTSATNSASRSSHTSNKTPSSRVDITFERAIRALVFFTSEKSARDLFAFENGTALEEEIAKVKKEKDLNGAQAYQQGLKRLWKGANQELWEEKAKKLREDIHGNQQEFAYVMSAALDRVAEKGLLGSCMMGLFYVFRNKDNVVETGSIYSGFNTLTNKKITPQFPNREELEDAWHSYARTTIPSTQLNACSKLPPFKRNNDGMLLFPSVNTMETPPSSLRLLLQKYMSELWDMVESDSRDASRVPWAAIADTPEQYYDTSKYYFPVVLKDIDTYEDPSEIIQLVRFLRQTTKSTAPGPFQFRRLNVVNKPPNEPSNSCSSSPVSSPITSGELPSTPVSTPAPSPLTTPAVPDDPPAPNPAINPPSREISSSAPNLVTTGEAAQPAPAPAITRSPAQPAPAPAITRSPAPPSPPPSAMPRLETKKPASHPDPPELASTSSKKRGKKRKSSEVPEQVKEPVESLGKRKRREVKQMTFGLKVLVDPAQPPPKKAKPSWKMIVETADGVVDQEAIKRFKDGLSPGKSYGRRK